MVEVFENRWPTCIAMRGWFLKWGRAKPIRQVLLWWVHRTTNSRPLWLIRGETYWEDWARHTVLSVLHPWSWWSTVEVCNKLLLDWSDIDLIVEFRNWKPKLLPFTWKCAVEWRWRLPKSTARADGGWFIYQQSAERTAKVIGADISLQCQSRRTIYEIACHKYNNVVYSQHRYRYGIRSSLYFLAPPLVAILCSPRFVPSTINARDLHVNCYHF